MTKKDLIARVCNENPSVSKAVAEEAVHLFFQMISFYLMHHQRIELRGFGVFSVRARAAHCAHNPQTGDTITVPEKHVPFFKASQVLKDALKHEAVQQDNRPSWRDNLVSLRPS